MAADWPQMLRDRPSALAAQGRKGIPGPTISTFNMTWLTTSDQAFIGGLGGRPILILDLYIYITMYVYIYIHVYVCICIYTWKLMQRSLYCKDCSSQVCNFFGVQDSRFKILDSTS